MVLRQPWEIKSAVRGAITKLLRMRDRSVVRFPAIAGDRRSIGFLLHGPLRPKVAILVHG
jgi:hypothetical protein